MIEKFMQERGKAFKPAKEKKDGKKITAKERNELIDKMLVDLGYVKPWL